MSGLRCIGGQNATGLLFGKTLKHFRVCALTQIKNELPVASMMMRATGAHVGRRAKGSHMMGFRITTLVSGMAGGFGIAATTAMAQAGEMPLRSGYYEHGHDMMWGNTQWGGFGMVLGPIFMILIVVGILAAMIYLLRLYGTTGSSVNVHASPDRALALLMERYAKGEIDSTEFAERKKLLAG